MPKAKVSSERIKKVAELEFADEEGIMHRFTWRTISTWLYRFKLYGITGLSKRQP
jgi:hypothetical protein